MPNHHYLIALGGNLPSDQGTPAHTLAAALSDLEAAGVILLAVSRFFDTPCFPAGAGPDYVNAAARLASDLDPSQMLALLHRIEAFNGFGYRRAGRVTPYLWSFSSLYGRGKFVADGRFDPKARSQQCGAAVMLKLLESAGELG